MGEVVTLAVGELVTNVASVVGELVTFMWANWSPCARRDCDASHCIDLF